MRLNANAASQFDAGIKIVALGFRIDRSYVSVRVFSA